jgi:hypothetical protein
MGAEEKAEYQKALKNLGVYTYPRTIFRNDGNSGNKGWDCTSKICMRKIISQSFLDSTKDHYMRIRVASDGKQGKDNEFALDFLELVPKSVYGTDGDEIEDDL